MVRNTDWNNIRILFDRQMYRNYLSIKLIMEQCDRSNGHELCEHIA